MDGFKARPRRTSYSDGVTPQRSSVGSNVSTNNANKPSISATPYPPISASTQSTVEPPSKVGVSKAELDESLRSIDTPDISKKVAGIVSPKVKKDGLSSGSLLSLFFVSSGSVVGLPIKCYMQGALFLRVISLVLLLHPTSR